VALQEVRRLTAQLAAYVNNVGNGNENVLLGSGFDLRALPTPVGLQPAPSGIRLTTDLLPLGTVRIYHKGNPKRRIYHYQHRPYPDGKGEDTPWMPFELSTRREHVFSGLESGRQYQFRVRVETAAGPG